MPSKGLTTVVLLSLVSWLPAAEEEADRWEQALRRSRPQILQSAAEVDRLVRANWERHAVKPSLQIRDQIFMRRAYLDITGTIPTGQQALNFLDAKQRDKRQLLIDRLLMSDGYVSHFYNYWADVLRIKSQVSNIEFHGYVRWVKDALRANVPYDRFVYELLTADGRISYNGAAGYFLRDQGMPLDNTSNTTAIFLGTQIGCAQCHDHPFEAWTQKQFYEMAAFTYGIHTRVASPEMRKKRREVQAEMSRRGISDAERRTVNQLVSYNQWAISDAPDRRLRFPKDYQYDDVKPNALVTPAALFGQEAGIQDLSGRQAFARWITASDNPLFAKVIANRLWKKLLGIGLIEPVDAIESAEASNPELLKFLTQEMVRMNFNIKQFLRLLLNTDVYQRRAVYLESTEEPFHFPGPVLRRMTAEQIWDSLVTLSMEEPLANEYAQTQRYRFPQFDLRLTSAREIVDRGLKAHAERDRGRQKKKQPPPPKQTGPNLFRASEMRQPVPPGHFLRDFGSSDRELIDGGNTDPTVTQILTLINGPHHYQIIREGSVLTGLLKQFGTNPRARARVIYLSILGREPNKSETRLALSVFLEAKQPRRGNNELIWILLNTPEFMFIQ